jgi:hypothetical protein
MGEFQILLGVVIGFQMIIRLGADKLQKILAVLEKPKNPDPKRLWKKDLDTIHYEFMRDMIFKVDRILLRFDDVLAYSHSVTVSQFSFQFGDDLKTEVLKDMAHWASPEVINLPPDLKSLDTQKEFEKQFDPKGDLNATHLINDRLDRRQSERDSNKTFTKLIDFEEIDQKIETMFGLKMGEFLKDDDILKSKELNQSRVKTKKKKDVVDSVQEDTLLNEFADELASKKSRRTGPSKNGKKSKTDRFRQKTRRKKV